VLKVKSFLLLFLIILPIFGWATTSTVGQEEPVLYVDPATVTVDPGETFTVQVKVTNVLNLYTHQFKLSWNPSFLEVTSVTEGPFLSSEGSYVTYFKDRIWNTPDPMGVSGYLYVGSSLLGEPATAAASGKGTLATIEFLVKEKGNTALHLYETQLVSSLMVEMAHQTKDGAFLSLPPAEINVEPSTIVDAFLQPGSTFSVNVSVIQAVGVYSWNLNMSWDPALLNVTSIEEGIFLNQSLYNTTFNSQISPEEGRFYANCSLFEEPPEVAASGNGTLLNVTFLVKSVGSTDLRLLDAKLWDYEGNEIFSLTQDGYFENLGLIRDVAVISVEASPSSVEAGDPVSITVVVRNNGGEIENFDVTVYWGDSNVGTLSTSDLNPNATETLIFNWNTEGTAEGNYTIKAVASAVIWETNTDDNTYTNGNVMITSPPPQQTFSFSPILVAAVIIVIIIVVTIIGIVLFRRRRARTR
jgi:hypothetical protein